MPLATGFARSSDVKSEVSRGHSRGNLKGRTLTTRVEVTTLMTNSSGPQNNVLEGGCHGAKRAEQRSVVYGKRRSSWSWRSHIGRKLNLEAVRSSI